MAREYFQSYHSYLEAMKSLNDTECGRLYRACLKYSITGIAPELRGNERFIFDSMKGQIDRDIENYAIKCEQNRDNVLRRYTNAYERKRTYTKPTKEKEKEKEKDISPSVIPPAKFKPPTEAEVSAYCKARNNKVDASQFVDFYSSKGWKVGNQPMKDWQAAVRTWEKRGDKPAKRTHNHSTRNYTPEELSAIGRDLLEDV